MSQLCLPDTMSLLCFQLYSVFFFKDVMSLLCFQDIMSLLGLFSGHHVSTLFLGLYVTTVFRGHHVCTHSVFKTCLYFVCFQDILSISFRDTMSQLCFQLFSVFFQDIMSLLCFQDIMSLLSLFSGHHVSTRSVFRTSCCTRKNRTTTEPPIHRDKDWTVAYAKELLLLLLLVVFE